VLLYNYEKPEAQSTLKGLSEEGFGLCWNPKEKGILAGASGKDVCLW